jgi:hypothetical protein
MKQLLIIILSAFTGYTCMAQEKVDLEKLTFKDDPHVILKQRKRTADQVEPLTTLPAYTTYDVPGYSFGPVSLTEHCFVSFILNSIAEKKEVGLLIGFDSAPESKAINKYIFQKYGKPVVIARERQLMDKNKPYPSSSAYMWKNVRPGVTLVLAKSYVFDDNKPVENTNLVLINNDAKPSYESSIKTVLDKIIKTYTP